MKPKSKPKPNSINQSINKLHEIHKSLREKVVKYTHWFSDPITNDPIFEYTDMDELVAKLNEGEVGYLQFKMAPFNLDPITVPSINGKNQCFYTSDVLGWIDSK